ncbi:MAG: geranylgeranyl reductase family protein [Deltaproteobacteria bacterium]|nr:geranylgeranyl reductase family protein [Deltaproteobacteria bacterium]
MSYDVIVAGLGPAGSVAAYTLASRGFKVLGLDKEKFPRYKSCGGCVSVKAVDIVDFSFMDVVEETVRGAVFTYRSGRPVEIVSDRPAGYSVMRDRFDHLLMQKAKGAGACIIDESGARVTSIEDNGGKAAVKTASGKTYTAKFVIGADGAGGVIGREYFGFSSKMSGVTITSEIPYDRSAFKEISQKIFVDFGSVPYGYAWIFPKQNYLSIGVACDSAKAKSRTREYFDAFAASHGLLKGFKVREKTGWTVPVFYDEGRGVVKGRVLLAGDTGHLVDPFLGEGIYYAMLTGKKAALTVSNCLSSGTADLTPYQTWLIKEIYPEFKAAEKIARLVYSYPSLWYSILEKNPNIMLRYYNVVRGEESCAEFYKWVLSRVRRRPLMMIRRWFSSLLRRFNLFSS